MTIPPELVDKAQEGDQIAISKVMKSCEGLVVQYAGIFYKDAFQPTLTYEDMLQQGYVGVWQSLRHYKPSKNIKFSTYTVYCIKSHMVAELRKLQRKRRLTNVVSWLPEGELTDKNKPIGYVWGEEEEDRLTQIKDILKTFPERTQKIMEEKYFTSSSRVNREIAADYNTTKDHISYIENTTLRRIRKAVHV